MISVVHHLSYVSGLISLKVNSFSLFQPFPFLFLFLFLLCSSAFLPQKSGVRSPFCPCWLFKQSSGLSSFARRAEADREGCSSFSFPLFPLFLHTWADVKQKIMSALWSETELLLSWAALWLQFDESQLHISPGLLFQLRHHTVG